MVYQLRTAQRILRLKQIQALLGISRSGIYDRLNPKSPRYDPLFPQPIKLGGRSVGFLESELEAWVQKRVEERGGGRH